MKTLLLSLITLIGFSLLAPPAEAGGSRYRDSHRSYSRSHSYYGGPAYRSRTRVYYDDCYRPSYRYYRPAPVYYYDHCYTPRYYSRPRLSFSVGF
jgi:hypothetical protein